MIEITFSSIPYFWPEIILALTFVVAMTVEFILGRKGRVYSGTTTGLVVLSGFIVAGLQIALTDMEPRGLFGTMYVIDPFSVFFKYFILATGAVIIVFSMQSAELRQEGSRGEFYCFIAAMTVGMVLMSGASNLLMLYMAVEMVSIPSYVLAGFSKTRRRSGEAALKYVIFGGASSGIMLYGISLLYGLTGALDLATIQGMLATGGVAHSAGSYTILIIAIVMITAGFGYKISAVPFHFWTPDVYEGAPITVTALLSVASKAAGFAMMIRFFYVTFFDALMDPGYWASLPYIEWNMLIAILSVLTMTLGNLVAIWQDNLKRMLAYSSIAHAGYMLMGLVVMSDFGIASILMYFIVYFFMNLGAFYIVMVVADSTGSEHIDDYNGLAARAPLLAAGLAICLVSLTGLPPLAGFIGKWMLFSAVMDGQFYWLAVIGVINSAISLYYYARVMRNMYLRDAPVGTAPKLQLGPLTVVITVLFIIPNILFGLYWGPLVSIAQRSAEIFLR
jgi:NADH-quinone oxidoreductase subunit N